jgi:hypothetical protein
MLRQCVAWRGRAGTGAAWSGEPWQTHGAFNTSVEVWYGLPSLGAEWQCLARQVDASRGQARQGMVRQPHPRPQGRGEVLEGK